ncbi:MAG: 3-deoxy-manno-octulosonate cytidylyltransferase [Bacteroidota bacterium]
MTETQRIVAVIPARYSSQRLPAKPLIDLLGKPMVQRVYEQATRASLVGKVVVATDDERIASVVRDFGGEAILTPSSIRSGSDRVAAVALKTEGDIFVNVQGDEPLIPPAMIDEAVRTLLEDDRAVAGTLAKNIVSHEELLNPAVVKVVMDVNGYALYFSRSAVPFFRDEPQQTLWPTRMTYYKHIGIYVFRRSFLAAFARMPESTLEAAEKLEQLRILENGYSIKVGITEHDSIPIDTQEDVERVRRLLGVATTKGTS